MKHRDTLIKLKAAGHDAWFVGGCVRDTVLGREPKDVDIATSALPDEIRAVFPDAEMVGAHFGVSLVRDADGHVEIATYRKDGVYSDGRRPDEVEFTKDVQEDIHRRDFKMNAMLMDESGAVLDQVGGMIDLSQSVISCIGDPNTRFSEDGLRMMRAVRFACQLDFTIASRDTYKAIFWNRDLLIHISMERKSDELAKILTSGKAAYGVRLLADTGLMTWIVPEFIELKHQDQNWRHHPEGTVFTHTILLLKQLQKGCSLALALAALLHDIGKPKTAGVSKYGWPNFHGHEDTGAVMAEEILRRLKFPNEVVDRVVWLVANHMRFMVAKEMRRSKLVQWVRQDGFEELLELHRMDAISGSGDMENYNFVKQAYETMPAEYTKPQQLINGDDLIAMGMTPGPKFKEILAAVDVEFLEDRVSTKEQALEFAKEFMCPI